MQDSREGRREEVVRTFVREAYMGPERMEEAKKYFMNTSEWRKFESWGEEAREILTSITRMEALDAWLSHLKKMKE